MTASYFGWARDAMGYGESSLGNLQFNGQGLFYLYFYVRNTVTTLRDVMATIPHTVPYQGGYLSFGALASILPGHHVSSDMFFRQILGLNFLGFGQPATLLGPMYGDFGLIGIISEMFAFGMIYARVYSWMSQRRSVLAVLIYAWISQTALFSLFGALLTYAITIVIPLGWILLNLCLRTRNIAEATA